MEIIACEGNFHGRSIAIVAMSSEAQYRDGFGPFPAGFKRIPFGDADALERAITPQHRGVPGGADSRRGRHHRSAGGYLARCAEICRRHNVLLICDEVQTGLGRTGRMLASEHEGVRPDGLILGKALGGGLLPVSAFLARRDVMDVYSPGRSRQHVRRQCAGGRGRAGRDRRAARGATARARARSWATISCGSCARSTSPLIREVRGKGLLIGVEFEPRAGERAAGMREAAGARRADQGYPPHRGPLRAAADRDARADR